MCVLTVVRARLVSEQVGLLSENNQATHTAGPRLTRHNGKVWCSTPAEWGFVSDQGQAVSAAVRQHTLRTNATVSPKLSQSPLVTQTSAAAAPLLTPGPFQQQLFPSSTCAQLLPHLQQLPRCIDSAGIATAAAFRCCRCRRVHSLSLPAELRCCCCCLQLKR